jgi:hypothetical protein
MLTKAGAVSRCHFARWRKRRPNEGACGRHRGNTGITRSVRCRHASIGSADAGSVIRFALARNPLHIFLYDANLRWPQSFQTPEPEGSVMQTKRLMLSLGLAIGSGLAAQGAVFAQEYRGTEQQQMACTPDVWRLCSSQIPDVNRIVACLRANTQNLSDGCRAVFAGPPPEPRDRVAPRPRGRPAPPPYYDDDDDW